jgi:hypothetical protein
MIPRYLKVYTRSISSPSNTHSWHGSTKLNTMTFVFFTFTISPHSTQNCWSMSNCCYNSTSDSNVRMMSFVKKIAIHASLLGLVHRILCYPSALIGHPNIAQIVKGWEDSLASHLISTWSWRWHLCLGGWCVRYPWHTSLVGIVKSVHPPRSQSTPATTLHVAQYWMPFKSPQNNNKVASFLPYSFY